jgi:hypothetical protein
LLSMAHPVRTAGIKHEAHEERHPVFVSYMPSGAKPDATRTRCLMSRGAYPATLVPGCVGVELASTRRLWLLLPLIPHHGSLVTVIPTDFLPSSVGVHPPRPSQSVPHVGRGNLHRAPAPLCALRVLRGQEMLCCRTARPKQTPTHEMTHLSERVARLKGSPNAHVSRPIGMS